MKSTSIVALLALLAIALPPGVSGQDYAVRPGDEIDVKFYTAAGTEIGEITAVRTVDRNGDIFMPYIGSLAVTGLDAVEIRELLEERYSAFYANPVVDVTAALKVNVTGAVPRPGSFLLDPTSTLVDAVSEAGGTGTGLGYGGQIMLAADASRIRLVRDGEVSIIDMSSDDPSLEALQRIRSGDWLYVPPVERSVWRDNINFISDIVTLLAATAGLILIFSN